MPESDDDERELAEFMRRALADWKRQKAGQEAKTIRELYAAWMEVQEGHRAVRGRAIAKYVLRMRVPWAGGDFVLGDLKWTELDRKRFDAWMGALRAFTLRNGKHLLPGSRDQVRLRLQQCFKFHLDQTRLVGRNPLHGFPLEEKESRMRKAYFTPELLQRFLEHARPMLAVFVRFLARTGLRKTEALRLRKDQIDHETRELVLIRKGGRQKRVLIPDDAYELLQALIKVAPGDYVFANPRDPRGGFVPAGTMESWFRAAREKAGIKMLGEDLVIHSLRHGYALGMLEAGAPIHYVSQQLGHSNTHQLERRYARLRGPEKERYRQMLQANPLGLDAKKKPPDPTK